jgi:hypothetical protein
MKCECKRCGYGWYSKVKVPKQCPKCKNYRWKITEDLPAVPDKICHNNVEETVLNTEGEKNADSNPV